MQTISIPLRRRNVLFNVPGGNIIVRDMRTRVEGTPLRKSEFSAGVPPQHTEAKEESSRNESVPPPVNTPPFSPLPTVETPDIRPFVSSSILSAEQWQRHLEKNAVHAAEQVTTKSHQKKWSNSIIVLLLLFLAVALASLWFANRSPDSSGVPWWSFGQQTPSENKGANATKQGTNILHGRGGEALPVRDPKCERGPLPPKPAPNAIRGLNVVDGVCAWWVPD